MKLPHALVESVREGKAVLFLGSGASKGAIHSTGKTPPDGQQLANLIADKFLGVEYRNRPLDHVAALAISEADLIAVQNFIASVFVDFHPADFHKLIPKFRWSALVTTNYDLIVERAYADSTSPLQHLEPFLKNSQRIEERIREPSAVMYLKLHGCITKVDDPDIPMILTPEQYITHRRNRSRLFEKFSGMAHEFPILFVGHSLSDVDIRIILFELAAAAGENLPRFYIVAPDTTDADERYWASRKATCIKAKFDEVLSSLSSSLLASA